jgi:thioesterase III
MDTRITRTTVNVRNYHLDAYAHVNNARYMEFLEEGRWAYLAERPELARKLAGDIALVMVNLNISFLHGAVLHDKLEVMTSLARLGDRSVVMSQTINRIGDDRRVVEATPTFVLLDTRQKKALGIQGDLEAALRPLLLPPAA